MFAFPFALRTSMAAKADIGQLLRFLDSNKNGTVTKDEFLQFKSQTFDRLDANTNDRLGAISNDVAYPRHGS